VHRYTTWWMTRRAPPVSYVMRWMTRRAPLHYVVGGERRAAPPGWMHLVLGASPAMPTASDQGRHTLFHSAQHHQSSTTQHQQAAAAEAAATASRVTRYPILILSSPISILSSYGHLPCRCCHLPYRYFHLKVISVSILSSCHLVDSGQDDHVISGHSDSIFQI
jgi:hypothetical protein